MNATIKQLLPNLTEAVRRDHEAARMAHGHGFLDHVYRVAQVAYKIAAAEYGEEAALLAAAAGLCHNADRLLAHMRGLGHRSEVPDSDVRIQTFMWLAKVPAFNVRQRQVIVNAVLDHGYPNEPGDDEVTIALKDADRVVNAALDVVIRSGQFHADLPVIDFGLLLDDARGRYNVRLTVVADLVDCLDWGNFDTQFGVRTRTAQRMIASRIAKLYAFLKDYERQLLDEEGVVPGEFAGAGDEENITATAG